jgi:hypothetical protein
MNLAARSAHRQVDAGREAVYAAELAAFDGTSYEALAPITELVELAGSVTGAAWWPHGPIDVVAARSDAGSSSTRQRGAARPAVRLAAGQMTPATVVHELAHVLAGLGAGHGPRFRRAYVDLVTFCWGSDAAGWLRAEFEAAHLPLGAREWPMPAAASGGAGRLGDGDARPVGGPIAL